MELSEIRAVLDGIDREMAELFARRMDAAERVAEIKAEKGLPLTDPQRENEMFARNCALPAVAGMPEEYERFLRCCVECSKDRQRRILDEKQREDGLKCVTVHLRERSYPIYSGAGALSRITVPGRALIVTDDGVPAEYAETVSRALNGAEILTLPQGEAHKDLTQWQTVLTALTEMGLTRADCAVAVGGGTVSDVVGFAAATYLRGIGFYTVPTTLLAQVDASVGGKTGVDFSGFKNAVGAFYQPRGVWIDPTVLNTLTARQSASGMAEVVKAAAVGDAELFGMLLSGKYDLPTVIDRAVDFKRRVVETDETDRGLRRVLNFGHTLGHALEAASGYTLTHGEAVGLGMLPLCAQDVREKVRSVLISLGLPVACPIPAEAIKEALKHDKKSDGTAISAVFCPAVGKYEIRALSAEELLARYEEVFG